MARHLDKLIEALRVDLKRPIGPQLAAYLAVVQLERVRLEVVVA
jgi:hypothetical protein